MIDLTRTLSYNITIQCSLDGFCFVVHDIGENKIVDIGMYQTSETDSESLITEALEKALADKGLQGKPFHSVRYIVGNRFNTLVPEELFDEQQAGTYFHFNHDLPKNYILKCEKLPALGSVNVFAIPAQLEQYLHERWDNAVITHQSTVFLDSVMREANDDPAIAYVNVNSRSFDLAILENHRLVFFNNFKFNTKDDFAYFLMLALEQQHLDGKTTPVCFMGLITSSSEIIRLCERYVKHLRFIRPDGKVNVDMALNDIPFHYYYIPYQSLCES